MRKIWTIAQKELYIIFRDRNLVLVMMAAPLTVATLIGLAFGGGGGSDISIRDIPVAIVNLDTGANEQNYGAVYVNAFLPPESGTSAPACPTAAATTTEDGSSATLQDLTNAVLLDDAAAARAAVDAGEYTAAIIIPADFSARISYAQNKPIEAGSVEVYANGGHAITAGVIRSITESIGSQIATGTITVAATIDSLIERARSHPAFGLAFLAASQNGSFQPDFACAFVPNLSGIGIEQQTVEGRSSTSPAALLVFFGASQAMFFSLFMGQEGVNSLFIERRQGTLQRLIVSPTPRLYILIGKLGGTFIACTLQLVFLFIALTLVGSILNGGLLFIWGNNLPMIGLTILGAALAATGLGTLMAGLARTPEQGQIISQLLNIGLAALGGSFGFQLPEAASRFSVIYWGADAFRKLAAGQNDITLNLIVLFAHGIILFTVGFWFFNRRADI